MRDDVSRGSDILVYPAIRSQGRLALRRAVLDAASRLLVQEGLPALTLRRVAREVGCSTTVLYTLFGGKPGIVAALWQEGFDRLWQAEAGALASDDLLERLTALGEAYRANALQNPDYYRLMFGGAVPSYHPSDEAGRDRPTFRVLVDAVQACIDAGLLRPEDPAQIALVLWATVHGVVSLELSGNLSQPEASAIFRHAMRAVGEGFSTGGARPSGNTSPA